MSAKNQKYNKPVSKPVQKGNQSLPRAKVAIAPEYPEWFNAAILAGVLVITFWCYHFSLSNQFTNWDDGVYVYENSYVKNLSPYNINMILFHDITQNYYHPITMLSLALNWHYSGDSPQAYYIVEILMHLLNTVLVFLLSFALFKSMAVRGYGKIKYIPWLAGLCALWQGIDPMHVESVSWLAERKDVLYLFFYLAGLIFYVKYINGEKIPWMKYVNIIPVILFLWGASIVKGYNLDWKIFHSSVHVSEQLILVVLALLFAAVSIASFRYKSMNIELFYVAEMFLFSITSKPLAVVFPLSLFTIDILLKRKIQWKLAIEKIPFFLISLIFGFIAYVWANEGGSITSFQVFTLVQRVMFVGSNYLMYLVKLFAPFHLSSYYPYPELTDSNNLPYYFYLAPFAAILITCGLIYLAYKKGENYFRVALFGFGFYFFNVMFILQFVSAGPAIMADRYSYAAYFGFMFMLVYFIYVVIDKWPKFKTPMIIIITGFSCMLAYLCEARTEVWHNTKTLWQDVIKKYPATIDTVYTKADHSQYVIHIHPGVETAYKNLGNYYVQDKTPPDYDSAYMNYVVLENIKSKDAGVYSNLGNIWAIRNNIPKSLAEYTKSLSLDKKNMDTYLDRAITYSRIGLFDSAMRDYNHAFMLDSTSQKLLENRAFTLLDEVKNYPAALADYNRLIAIEPNNHDYYFKRGIAEFNMGKTKEAIDDFMKELNTNPKNGNCLYDLSLAYKSSKEYSKAIDCAQKAMQYQFKLPEGYMAELQKLAKTNG